MRNLEKLFQTEYDRLDVRNHVPAVIDQQSLDAAVWETGLSDDTLMRSAHETYAELNFPPGFRLECLHGRDRIQAAAPLLPAEDKR